MRALKGKILQYRDATFGPWDDVIDVKNSRLPDLQDATVPTMLLISFNDSDTKRFGNGGKTHEEAL